MTFLNGTLVASGCTLCFPETYLCSSFSLYNVFTINENICACCKKIRILLLIYTSWWCWHYRPHYCKCLKKIIQLQSYEIRVWFVYRVATALKFNFLLKTDDDCFLDVVRILDRLQSLKGATKTWLGRYECQ